MGGVVIFLMPRFIMARPRIFLLSLVALPLGAGVSYFLISNIPVLANFFRLNMGLSGREVIWGVGIFMILRNPWFGYGYGAAGKFTESISTTLLTLGFPVPGAAFHNTYLTYMFEEGVIAFCFYFLLYVIPLWLVAKAPIGLEEKRFLLASNVTIILLNLWIDNNIGGLRITSLLVGFFLGYAYLRAKDARSQAIIYQRRHGLMDRVTR
jgi:O-antigen ligase